MEDTNEYEEIREEYEDCNDYDCGDDADNKYDMMRDDFLIINNEQDALDCIIRYPSQMRFLPNKYKYLLEVTR